MSARVWRTGVFTLLGQGVALALLYRWPSPYTSSFLFFGLYAGLIVASVLAWRYAPSKWVVLAISFVVFVVVRLLADDIPFQTYTRLVHGYMLLGVVLSVAPVSTIQTERSATEAVSSGSDTRA